MHSPMLLRVVCVRRAIIIRNNEIVPMSTEFTPESERQRLQFLVRDPCLLSEVSVRGEDVSGRKSNVFTLYFKYLL